MMEKLAALLCWHSQQVWIRSEFKPKQGRKRPLDTPKRMIEIRER